MNRISPNGGRKHSFVDHRELPASEFFVPASEIAEQSNFRARTIAQLAIVDEEDRE